MMCDFIHTSAARREQFVNDGKVRLEPLLDRVKWSN